MADNVPITAGTGTNIATEDDGGVHFQKFWVNHRSYHAAEICNGTMTIGVADSTSEKDGPTLTIPATDLGLGERIGVIVRNPANQEIELRLRHQWTDPNGSTTRYAAQSTSSGHAYATIQRTTIDDGGVMVWFDGGLLPVGAKFTLKATAVVDATYTISVVAWIRN